MESMLVNGRFTTQEAEQLLLQLFRVKKDFHNERAASLQFSKENMKRSERRLDELQMELDRIIHLLEQGKYSHVALRAKLTLEFCPDYEDL